MQSKSVSASTTGAVVVKPDAGYTGLDQVSVVQVKLQEKSVTPSTSQQIFTPDSGYTGLSQVLINPPSGQTVKKITATVAGDAKNYLDISNTAGISDILAVYVCASISYARLSDGQIYSAAYFKDANATNGAMVKTTDNGISALLPTAVGVSLVSGNIRVQVAVPNIFLYADYSVCIYGT